MVMLPRECQHRVFYYGCLLRYLRISVILTGMGSILLVDKPGGLTSFRVVELIRKKFGVKAGHTGTLDPMATGLLIVLTDERTKDASSFLAMDKSYQARAILGMETDTFDLDGKLLRRSDKKVGEEELERVLKGMRGDIYQVPPPFSAKKVAGRRAYKLARKGIAVNMPASKVTIYSLDLVSFQFPYFTVTCDVSSGFYVRSLVHDIGEKLKVGAVVVELRRTRIGHYRVEQAKRLEEILGYKEIPDYHPEGSEGSR